MPNELVSYSCTLCGHQMYAYFVGRSQICATCSLVQNILLSTKDSCGKCRFAKASLPELPAAVERLSKAGWQVRLHKPSPWDVAIGYFTLTVKTTDAALCKGKPNLGGPCPSVGACSAPPTPEDVRESKQRACRLHCPVDPFEQEDAHAARQLPTRCAAALSTYTCEPVSVTIKREDMPALLSNIERLQQQGWKVTVHVSTSRRKIGSLELTPA